MRKPTGREAGLAVASSTLIAGLVLWFPGNNPVGRSADDTGSGSVHTPSSFTISGDIRDAITSGVLEPLDLSLDNPNDVDLAIDQVTVTVEGIEAPRANADHPCSAADFDVRQLSGSVVLSLEGNHADSLSGMGVARDHWPAVGLLDRPVNQDGCKGASLTLGYEASGVEVRQ